MSEYLISEQALDDLNNIWIYTATNWSIEQADKYYNLIMDEIEFVAKNYEKIKSFQSVRKDYRYSKVKSHLIFCKKNNANEIEIIRILHEKMDIKNRINK